MAKGRIEPLQEAAEKWERKTSHAGQKWKANVTGHEAQYCANFSRFVGHTVSQACEEYNIGVNEVTAEDFDQAVKDKAVNYMKGLQQVR